MCRNVEQGRAGDPGEAKRPRGSWLLQTSLAPSLPYPPLFPSWTVSSNVVSTDRKNQKRRCTKAG